MAPTYTMSAHLCKQIYASWRQTRTGTPDHQGSSATPSSMYFQPSSSSLRAASPEKSSLEVDRASSDSSSSSTSMSRQSSASSWRSR